MIVDLEVRLEGGGGQESDGTKRGESREWKAHSIDLALPFYIGV